MSSVPAETAGPEAVPDPLAGLLAVLDLEPIEVNIFRGRSPDEERQRVFGGQVAGQALVAAGRTVDEDRRVHSLHAYFLRPGDPTIPILYEVDRIRDGRSFTTRRVVAIQHGEAIFHLSASFHVAEPGFEHRAPMPEVPSPDDLPTWEDRMKALEGQVPAWFARPRPVDTRFVQQPWRAPSADDDTRREPRQQVWMRAKGTLPDDPLLHACVVAYSSDMTLLDSVVMPHRDVVLRGGMMMASLDHAMWFHEPLRADEWFLYDQESPFAGGARGLAQGRIFRSDGVLAVSVVQEGLVRLVGGRR